MRTIGHEIRVKALFASDFHLGTKGCQAELLLEFLRRYDAEVIYLIGDIVDGWRLKSSWYWPDSHSAVVQTLLKKAKNGTRLVYLPGNHDEFLRDFIGVKFDGVEIAEQIIHETVDGRRLLVIHGDQFDVVVRHAKWLALLGDGAYQTALFFNRYVNLVRRRLGLTYWSLSSWAKLRVKNAVNFIGSFEEYLSSEAKRKGACGVVCGHIHHPADHDLHGIRYLNAGDWVESCTGIVEHHDGRIELVRWTEVREEQASEQVVRLRPIRGRAAVA